MSELMLELFCCRGRTRDARVLTDSCCQPAKGILAKDQKDVEEAGEVEVCSNPWWFLTAPSIVPPPPDSCCQSAPQGILEKDQKDIEVAELEELARRLATQVQKYPKRKKGLQSLWKPRDRYMKPLPAAVDSQFDFTPFERWKKGSLAYWESESDFLTGAEPMGSVPLWRIAKVSNDDRCHNGRLVVVRHVLNGERVEMHILLLTRADAQEFAYQLWELISKVRSQWRDEHIATVKSARSASASTVFGSAGGA